MTMEKTVLEELDDVHLRDVLDADSRPTFVIDLDPDLEAPDCDKYLLPVFCNAALRLHERLYDSLVGREAQGVPLEDPLFTSPAALGLTSVQHHVQLSSSYQEFKLWAAGVTTHDDSKDVYPLCFLYGDFMWSGSTVRKRWRLISGNRLWRAAEASGTRDLSSGILPEVATGGVRAKRAKRSREEPTTANPQALAEQPPAAAASAKPATRQQDSASQTATSTLVSSRLPFTSTSFCYQETPTGSSDETKGSSHSAGSLTLSRPEKAVTDWTVLEPKGILSAHLQFARSVNWASTPLGPMEKWSPEFRQLANLCMGNPHPAALFWGSELTMVYNEAYAAEVAGNKHPSLMGTGFSGPFSELWDYTGPVFAECARTGISVRKENDYLPIDRHNLLEETFYSWSFTPLYGGSDRILGFYNAPFETTNQVLGQRRTHTITKLGEFTAHAKTVKQFWRAVLDALETNHYDVPFALLYSVGDGEDTDHSSVSSGSTISLKTCYLEGSIGVPDGHVAAPECLDLKRSREGFVPSFREAMRTREPTLLHTRDGTLPDALLEGINWRGFGEPCREAIILPARPTNGDAVLAFVVLGVNPRRPYDDKYKSFTTVLHRQLATSLASIILFEEEVRRNRDAAEAAALEKELLTQQLVLQDNRLRRMTELSPLGMFLISPEGLLREANDRFYEMTGNTRDGQYEMSWMEFIMPTSLDTMKEGWGILVDDHMPWSGELQLKRRPTSSPVNLPEDLREYWVMFIAHLEFTADGSLRSIVGSIMDISLLKWALGVQDHRLHEAEETRRQQNEFIDITSHEMRNPLSAVLQCADDISTSLSRYKANTPPPPWCVVESCIESAHTIALCVQHQKSIVDDILTISKLDSNLLLITPSIVQPDIIMRRALKMFESELESKKIEVVFEKHPSYGEYAVDWVTLDPSRILQILINLMTNAIKFTATSQRRLITVGIGASLTPPGTSHNLPGFEYVPAKSGFASQVKTTGDWGDGELLYIHFKVEDTGCGLTEAEKQILFQRFKQASPRTHAQYGGSGLGLFISKHLTELHGGQIGVASESGSGSLFALYVQARRSPPPPSTTSYDTEEYAPPLATEVQFSDGGSLSSQVTPQRQDYATARAGESVEVTRTNATLDPRDLHILVVEDNLINQKVLVGQLRKTGCTVSAANDGLEALEFLEKTHFRTTDGTGSRLSIILMDLEMPNMDGLTCVRQIRRMEDEGKLNKHVPVVAVTANVRDEQVATAKSSGMDDVVSKPFIIPDLLKKIEMLLLT
ncbi:unnamed protein product [Clonostachys rhizophaga]|uniref:Uncharacterized protein n=1 Tax=Clonostachys rhizophaga TaxID=160324 RepID=A0A9N9VVQ0_9HYPO|nr:unnamed protein product [Clonostachys rhizophaga]